jgi:hypothetical protein
VLAARKHVRGQTKLTNVPQALDLTRCQQALDERSHGALEHHQTMHRITKNHESPSQR